MPGCRQGGRVPVHDVGEDRVDGATSHRVRPGDTLYSIAWRYGLDYRQIASDNDIAPPYTIYVDQMISLAATPVSVGKRPAARTGEEAATPVKRDSPVEPPATKAGELSPRIDADGFSWQWPLRGRIVRGFSLKGTVNKGLDIKGGAGSRVNAAADGIVVYAGGNLRGYGKLVIVKHSAQFLSAYGNNEDIRVREGERVKQGQMLASVGSSAMVGASSPEPLLHFEIRRNGKPEDPLRYLPAR